MLGPMDNVDEISHKSYPSKVPQMLHQGSTIIGCLNLILKDIIVAVLCE